MHIRVTVLGSGSAGNATLIEGDGARVLLDAGFSCRELAARLRGLDVAPDRLDALVITHEHADHVRGAERFCRTFGVPVYATRATARAAGLADALDGALHEVTPGTPFAIGGLTLMPFPLPHDAVDTVGYTIECGDARVGYATDLGHATDAARRGLRDCDLLILEANHDVGMLQAGPYPAMVKQRVLGRHGHLDNDSSAALACEAVTDRTRHLILAHLSRTNNRPDLALQATRQCFERDGRRAPRLYAASQARASPRFEI